MRIKVTTTIEESLWRRLQVQAIKQGRDANDILEELITSYLKKKGGE
jgi:hypothetical protein